MRESGPRPRSEAPKNKFYYGDVSREVSGKIRVDEVFFRAARRARDKNVCRLDRRCLRMLVGGAAWRGREVRGRETYCCCRVPTATRYNNSGSLCLGKISRGMCIFFSVF